jgi:hypothetical protein
MRMAGLTERPFKLLCIEALIDPANSFILAPRRQPDQDGLVRPASQSERGGVGKAD